MTNIAAQSDIKNQEVEISGQTVKVYDMVPLSEEVKQNITQSEQVIKQNEDVYNAAIEDAMQNNVELSNIIKDIPKFEEEKTQVSTRMGTTMNPASSPVSIMSPYKNRVIQEFFHEQEPIKIQELVNTKIENIQSEEEVKISEADKSVITKFKSTVDEILKKQSEIEQIIADIKSKGQKYLEFSRVGGMEPFKPNMFEIVRYFTAV